MPFPPPPCQIGLKQSLWLPKLGSILQKPAKCSTDLHAPLGVEYVRIAPIECFVEFLKYTALSAQSSTHICLTRTHALNCFRGTHFSNSLETFKSIVVTRYVFLNFCLKPVDNNGSLVTLQSIINILYWKFFSIVLAKLIF